MASEKEGEASQQSASPPTNLTELVQQRYQKMKEHVESYPYVWASYTLVYGTLALWTAYRWRKLRKIEDKLIYMIYFIYIICWEIWVEFFQVLRLEPEVLTLALQLNSLKVSYKVLRLKPKVFSLALQLNSFTLF
ncbi:hypothetical protein COLO4_36340 [Corchorus olitorius]|uniref:Uncharacterized protein n=1 Tax=Corchorus olitorius TaxID=93759 RepID=A0A1R3G9T6_9ROSI|nr:hypothetical protein COLO4_36340 [Corchorus olitorius]